MSATDPTATPDGAADTPKVPNNPSSAFAALSLDDPTQPHASTSRSPFTQVHLAGLDSSTNLVHALNLARNAPKPLIRSTGHLSQGHHLLSWKVSEFAYRKSTSVGSELPTLARGLFTERISTAQDGQDKHRIVVRGYDKFFNLSEMPWTKPASIDRYTTGPYVLTFKENGCIIFISALSPTQLVVSSKHALASTHAEKGEEWLLRHLSSVGRTREELAAELWRRNETAAFELCDDSFEEHVLTYSEARSGLHLHGLNANQVKFSTRPMAEVDEFAKKWGFIPTRWLTLETLDEVKQMTAEIEETGMWEGEAIEGFVIRTHMPDEAEMARMRKEEKAPVAPPYDAGQAWFYKVKFDEPYLMYRDWRELARKMVKEKEEWEAKLATTQQSASSSSAPTPSLLPSEPTSSEPSPTRTTPQDATSDVPAGEEKSKSALKREKKKLAKLAAKSNTLALSSALSSGHLPPPPPPQPRSKRPETLLFIQWAYDRLYGNPTLRIAPQPSLFAPLAHNKGIIAMRHAFLAHLAATTSTSAPKEEERKGEGREFSKTILTPVAVPGCGKTVLAIALKELFGVGVVQSDDFKAKKGFLGAVERDMRTHAADKGYVLFADKNNHLFSHRDELIDLSRALSQPAPPLPAGGGKKGKKPPPEVGRVRTVALAWDLDALPLNTLHRVCAERIERRGGNHQTLVADNESGAIAGVKNHEVVLWRFLEALQPFGASKGKGEGAEGYGDAAFDHVIKLSVQASAKENLLTVVREMERVLGWKMPSEERIEKALEKAFAWKVAKRSSADKQKPKEEGEGEKGRGGARYFGLAVELDVRAILDSLLASSSDSDIASFYTALRTQTRLNLRPHITLVHSSSLSPPQSSSPPNDADRKWTFYTHLLSSPSGAENEATKFTLTLSQLLYERDTLLTFPVDAIRPPPHLEQQFWELHKQDWTPHITLGTRDNSVRPFEANRVVNAWIQNGKQPSEEIQVVDLPQPITVQARVFAMN